MRSQHARANTRFATVRARLIIMGYLDLVQTMRFLRRVEQMGYRLSAPGMVKYAVDLRQAVTDVCVGGQVKRVNPKELEQVEIAGR